MLLIHVPQHDCTTTVDAGTDTMTPNVNADITTVADVQTTEQPSTTPDLTVCARTLDFEYEQKRVTIC